MEHAYFYASAFSIFVLSQNDFLSCETAKAKKKKYLNPIVLYLQSLPLLKIMIHFAIHKKNRNAQNLFTTYIYASSRLSKV